MKHLALLAAVYALIAALVLPSSLLASEDAPPAAADTPAGETAPAGETPTAPAEPAPAPEQPAAAPEPAAPAPEQPATAPEQPAAGPEQAAAPAPSEQPARPGKHRTSAKAAGSGSVTIADFQFTPAQITINQGDTVNWTNNGPTAHSATAPDGSFDTGIFPAGQTRSHTFNDAGTFSYVCTPHPNMHGTIVVTASQSGGDTPDSNTGDTTASGGSGGTTGGSSGAEAAQSDGGPSLPSTGGDSGALLVLGALMLLLGVAVHRRARPEVPRPAGRIGW